MGLKPWSLLRGPLLTLRVVQGETIGKQPDFLLKLDFRTTQAKGLSHASIRA
jgi:hypothetical protein